MTTRTPLLKTKTAQDVIDPNELRATLTYEHLLFDAQTMIISTAEASPIEHLHQDGLA